QQSAQRRFRKALTYAAPWAMQECQQGIVALRSAVVVKLPSFGIDPALWAKFSCIRAPQLQASVEPPDGYHDICSSRDSLTAKCGIADCYAASLGNGWEQADCLI